MGVAEMVYNPELGLIWALMPVQYSLSFVIGKSIFLRGGSQTGGAAPRRVLVFIQGAMFIFESHNFLKKSII